MALIVCTILCQYRLNKCINDERIQVIRAKAFKISYYCYIKGNKCTVTKTGIQPCATAG